MAAHDWTGVDAGMYHDHHIGWMAELQRVMNTGLLPEGYYALIEQHSGSTIEALLNQYGNVPPGRSLSPAVAVAEVPPKAARRQTIAPASIAARRRTLAIRHVSEHRLVAILEVVSQANKDRAQSVADFVTKAASALESGVHVLMVDLFPPGPRDPNGMHSLILQRLDETAEPYDLPASAPLTLASYAAGPRIEVYLEHMAPGAPLPDMPLFLRPDRYVNVPLEQTYMAASRGMPAFWRDVLEGRDPDV